MKRTLCLLALLCAWAAAAERYPYERYASIVERQMFGALPEGFDPTKLPSEATRATKKKQQLPVELEKEQQKLMSAVRFSMLNVTPGGQVKVGFTDSSDKSAPRNYYLGVGESRDGWLVKAVDPDASTMTIQKGEIELSLSIGGDSSKDDKAPAKSVGAARANGAERQSRLLTVGDRRKNRLAQKAEHERMMRENADYRQRIEKMHEEQEKAQAEEEARRAQEKAEQDAKREQDQQELKTLRTNLEAMRQQIQEKRAQEAEAAASEDGADSGEDEN